MHPARRRIDLDDATIFRFLDKQTIGTRFKDAAILLFLFAQLFFRLHAFGDVMRHPQQMRLALVGEGGTVCFNMKHCAVFAQTQSLRVVLVT